MKLNSESEVAVEPPLLEERIVSDPKSGLARASAMAFRSLLAELGS